MLAALSYGGWPRVWTLYVLAWVGVFAIGALRVQGEMPTFVMGFPLWLLAAWWIGRQQPMARHVARTKQQTMASNLTRFGWQAAIHAIPTPVIVVRNDRLIEVNRSACEFIGRGERALVGSLVAECLVADPPDALDPVKHPSKSSVAVEIRPAGRTFDGALWNGRALHGTRSRIVGNRNCADQGRARAVWSDSIARRRAPLCRMDGWHAGAAVVSR